MLRAPALKGVTLVIERETVVAGQSGKTVADTSAVMGEVFGFLTPYPREILILVVAQT